MIHVSVGLPAEAGTVCRAAANNGLHPTADTTALIDIRSAGRRVMPGVRSLIGA